MHSFIYKLPDEMSASLTFFVEPTLCWPQGLLADPDRSGFASRPCGQHRVGSTNFRGRRNSTAKKHPPGRRQTISIFIADSLKRFQLQDKRPKQGVKRRGRYNI